MPNVRIPSLIAASGLAMAAASTSLAQSDPLSEPFPTRVTVTDLDGVLGFVVEAPQTLASVGAAGDINGDGIADFIAGTDADEGAVALVFGRDSSNPFPATVDIRELDGTNGFLIYRQSTNPVSGIQHFSTAGDVNGDGIDDVILGDPQSSGSGWRGGQVLVVFGRDTSAGATFPPSISWDELDGTTGFRVTASTTGGSAGSAVAGVGDFTGDGIDDFVLGAPVLGGFRGQAYVIFGRDYSAGAVFPPELPLSTIDGAIGLRVRGSVSGDSLGTFVGGPGDINGDDLHDVVVGAPFVDGNEGIDAGAAYVIYGRDLTSGPAFPAVLSVDGLDGINGFSLAGATRGSRAGPVAGAGDVNDDGMNDVIIGAPGFESASGRNEAGRAYVLFGRSGEPSFPPLIALRDLSLPDGFQIESLNESGGFCGQTVAAAGDMNSDGVDDLALAAPRLFRDGRVHAGEGYVVYGRAHDSSNPFPQILRIEDLTQESGVVFDAIDEPARLGTSMSGVGDVNSDGQQDFIITGTSGNKAFIVYGRGVSCPADLDADGTLTIFDFLAFGNLFDLMDPRADFDGDGDFTIFDFLAFQNAFDAGC